MEEGVTEEGDYEQGKNFTGFTSDFNFYDLLRKVFSRYSEKSRNHFNIPFFHRRYPGFGIEVHEVLRG